MLGDPRYDQDNTSIKAYNDIARKLSSELCGFQYMEGIFDMSTHPFAFAELYNDNVHITGRRKYFYNLVRDLLLDRYVYNDSIYNEPDC